MLTFYANVYSQKIVESLPDDQFVVEINGKEYRALNADKMRELLTMKADLEAEQKTNTELRIQIKEALLQRDLAQAQRDLEAQKAMSFKADFERAQEDAKRNYGLFIGERTLRQEATQFIPHGDKSKLDKFLSIFDRPATLTFFKIGLPLFQTWRCQ